MCFRHADRGTCGTWSTRKWSSSACGACFRRQWPGVSSGTCCTWHNRPCRGCCLLWPGNVRGGVVPHPANKGGRTAGLGFAAVDCCAVVADELQAEFIYEHVEGAKAVAGPRVRSVGIHEDVGIVGGPDEKLHEEPAQPAVVASRLVQACDLVVLVHGSHVPETCGSCSGSGWACGPSRRWHTELPGTGIRTGHVRSAYCQVPWGSACGLA